MRLLLRLAPLAAVLLASAPGLCAQRLYRLHEEIRGYGDAICGVGDVNGDGHADFLVGAPQADLSGNVTYEGLALLYSGADGSVLRLIRGDQAVGYLGFSVCGPGDLDGDGCPDFALSAPYYDTHLENAGRVVAYSGADGSVLFTLDGEFPGDFFGWVVCDAGDVNADGRPDLAVAVPRYPNYYGGQPEVRVYSGVDGTELGRIVYAGSVQDGFAVSLAGAGDVDGDGHGDLIVGIPYKSDVWLYGGEAWVYSGRTGQRLYAFVGSYYRSHFGQAVDGAGDVDGDGFDDLIVGEPELDVGYAEHPGAFHVFSGANGSRITMRYGDWAKFEMGSSVAGVGDVNDDGCADVIVGSPRDFFPGSHEYDERGYGSARVYSGADSTILYTVHGEVVRGWLGEDVAAAGDVNADGIDDFMVASSRYYTISAVYVFAGRRQPQLAGPDPGTAGVPNTLTVTGATPNGRVHFLMGSGDGRFRGRRYGRTMEPCRFDWGTIAIKPATRIGRLVADGSGTVSITRPVPAALSGHTLLLQAMDFESCAVTNRTVHAFP